MNDRSDAAVDAPDERANEAGRLRSLWAVAWLLLFGACAQQPTSTPAHELVTLQQRLQLLEKRVEILERYIWNLPSPPQRNREEIERNIQSLESKRSALLERYTNSHPEVREIDLSLRLLKLQLALMDQSKNAPK
jgi:predicted RNase H-like nuclease (RuvC/YqgF family)